jgi:hypothetical protein
MHACGLQLEDACRHCSVEPNFFAGSHTCTLCLHAVAMPGKHMHVLSIAYAQRAAQAVLLAPVGVNRWL